ncbi:hypothetical protein [Nocardia sp. NPDC047654]|uniref:hypothetical protein n=1 Tax=Nocardia sp. NPDC047654 TaxID=3364314 RepID=UPI0037110D23
MAQQRGETRANGWRHEAKIELGKGKGNTRVHDTARVLELFEMTVGYPHVLWNRMVIPQ